MWFCHESSGGLWLLSSWNREMWSTRGHIALWVAVKPLWQAEKTCCAVQDSLADARGVHLEKCMVHKQVKSFFLPGSPSVLISTEAAQQLDTCTITGGIVSAGKKKGESNKILIPIITFNYKIQDTEAASATFCPINCQFFILCQQCWILKTKYLWLRR